VFCYYFFAFFLVFSLVLDFFASFFEKTEENCTAIELPPLKYLGFSHWHFWEFPHKHRNLDF
jgi:hypothetical protein